MLYMYSIFIGDKRRVKVTHVNTPEEFYVQLCSREHDLITLQNDINFFVSNLAPSTVIPEIGEWNL